MFIREGKEIFDGGDVRLKINLSFGIFVSGVLDSWKDVVLFGELGCEACSWASSDSTF
jgi:hypothetical protein